MILLLKVVQVVLALSILIIVHEFGHFMFSKMFGARVEKFYLFFDANGIRLFSTKHSSFVKKHFPKLAESETDYGIGWLPFGGYCKITGMVDESMDTDFTKEEAKPYEFRSKKAWQRLLIMAGGVLNNFILAILLYVAILAIWGQSYVSTRDNEVYVNELAYDMGFRSGDRILALDDYVPDNIYLLQAEIARRGAFKVSVLRGGDTVNVYIDQSRMEEILNTPGMFDVAIPFVVDSVPEGSLNEAAGLEAGDRIVSVDSSSTPYLQDARSVLADASGMVVPITVLRDADSLTMDVQVDTAGRIGVYTRMPSVQSKKYGFLEAIPAGLKLTWTTIAGYVSDLKLVATPSTGAYKSVGSFVAIGQVFPNKWDWYQFINILAMLSIMLGVMNLLPIPALDGGHILFTLYEMVTGRKPSDKFLIAMQWLGMILIFMLMFLAMGNDILRLIR
ncbi:MAG: RIP metalloprotease RseP [Bacteroidales bacterium]|nr:RIP metalloprotease RseP [Candidatus Cryptobacteroides caccocaballi]